MWTGLTKNRFAAKYLFREFVNAGRYEHRTFCNRPFNNINSNKKIIFGLSSVGCVTASYYFLYVSKRGYLSNVSFAPVKAATKLESTQSPRATMNFIVKVVENVSPSVVYIETMGTQQTIFGVGVYQGHGSGFVIGSDGLILTNAHVVQQAKKLEVRMHDEKVYNGVVVALDRISDLALVKINATNLPVLKLANSGEAKAGEIVIALGSPLALSNSVTFGIISNSQRKLTEAPFAYIQTDAAITTGNSGGPLVNLDGEAVGINCMTVANAPGISFAIPSDYAKKFIQTASKMAPSDDKRLNVFKPRSKRKYMGITMFALDKEVLNEIKFRSFDFPNVDHGILVHTVTAGSPAHKCGIEPGDVIVAVEGKAVHRTEEIMEFLEKSTKSLTLSVVRRSEKLTLTIVPIEVDT